MLKWIIVSLVVLTAGLFFYFRTSPSENLAAFHDFEKLMGKEKESWAYVQTREDKENLAFFKRLYEKNFDKLSQLEGSKIPTTLHCIWLGPKEFPKESYKNVSSWIEKHPKWAVKFWTDIDRAAPHPKMEKVLVQESHLPTLLSCYFSSDNFGEKAELLSYEILSSEGGVVLHHDLLLHKNLNPFAGLDFYCGLEELGPSILSSSVFPSTHLIGARANHPIMRAAIDWVKKQWEKLESDYPGSESSAILNRVKHRAFSAFREGIMQKIDREQNCDLVFPSAYFSEKKKTPFSFASHLHAASWLLLESETEKKIAKECEVIASKISQTQALLFVSLLFSGGLLSWVMWRLFKGAKRETAH
jgi:hypothetical protein